MESYVKNLMIYLIQNTKFKEVDHVRITDHPIDFRNVSFYQAIYNSFVVVNPYY